MTKWKQNTLIGKTFGLLTVVKLEGSSTRHTRLWRCNCQCGKERIVDTAFLNNGSITHCGCSPKPRPGRGRVDLIGKKYGKLIVLEDAGLRKLNVMWKCRCECGGTKLVSTCHLKNKAVRSCGCLRSGRSSKGNPLEKGIGIRNIIISTYKNNAKLNNREFSLDISQCEHLFQRNCFYCGSPPSRTRTRRTTENSYTYNGIDRIDNSKGYTIQNTVSCCTVCNLRKASASRDEFLEWVKKVSLIHFK